MQGLETLVLLPSFFLNQEGARGGMALPHLDYGNFWKYISNIDDLTLRLNMFQYMRKMMTNGRFGTGGWFK